MRLVVSLARAQDSPAFAVERRVAHEHVCVYSHINAEHTQVGYKDVVDLFMTAHNTKQHH